MNFIFTLVVSLFSNIIAYLYSAKKIDFKVQALQPDVYFAIKRHPNAEQAKGTPDGTEWEQT